MTNNYDNQQPAEITNEPTEIELTQQPQSINVNANGQIVTTEEAISAVVNAEGDMDLAAEMLFGPAPRRLPPGQLPNKSRLIAILARDINAWHVLQRQLRVLTLVSTFTMSREIDVVLSGMLSAGLLSSMELVRLKNTVSTNLTTLTDDKLSVIEHRDSREALWDELPASVREAMKVVTLSSAPIDDTTPTDDEPATGARAPTARPTNRPDLTPPPLRSFTDDNGSGFSPATGTPHTSYR